MLEDYPPGDDLSSKEGNVVVVQGSFGIVYSAQVVKTKEELEAEEKHNKHGQAWMKIYCRWRNWHRPLLGQDFY